MCLPLQVRQTSTVTWHSASSVWEADNVITHTHYIPPLPSKKKFTYLFVKQMFWEHVMNSKATYKIFQVNFHLINIIASAHVVGLHSDQLRDKVRRRDRVIELGVQYSGSGPRKPRPKLFHHHSYWASLQTMVSPTRLPVGCRPHGGDKCPGCIPVIEDSTAVILHYCKTLFKYCNGEWSVNTIIGLPVSR